MPRITFVVPAGPTKGRDFRIEVDGKRAGAHRRRVTKELVAAMGHREDVTLRAKHFTLALLVALNIEHARRGDNTKAPYPFHVRPELASGRVRFWNPNQWSDPERSIREEIRRGFPFRDGEPNPVLSYDPLTGVATWYGETEFEFKPSLDACREYVFVASPVTDPDPDEDEPEPPTAVSHAVIVLEGLNRWDEHDLLPIERTVLGGVGGVLGMSTLELKPAFVDHGRMTITLSLPEGQIDKLVAAREKLAAWVRPLRLVHVGRLKPESSLLQKLAPGGSFVALATVITALWFHPWTPPVVISASNEAPLRIEDRRGSAGSVSAGSTHMRPVRVQANAIAMVEPGSEVQLLHVVPDTSETATVQLDAGRAIFWLEGDGPALEVYVPSAMIGVRLKQGRMRAEVTRTRCDEGDLMAVVCPAERFVRGVKLTISDGAVIVAGEARTEAGKLVFSSSEDGEVCPERPVGEPRKGRCGASAPGTDSLQFVSFVAGGHPTHPVRISNPTLAQDDTDLHMLLKSLTPGGNEREAIVRDPSPIPPQPKPTPTSPKPEEKNDGGGQNLDVPISNIEVQSSLKVAYKSCSNRFLANSQEFSYRGILVRVSVDERGEARIESFSPRVHGEAEECMRLATRQARFAPGPTRVFDTTVYPPVPEWDGQGDAGAASEGADAGFIP